MPNLKYLVFLAATTLSAQVHLRYLDLGPQPAPCCMTTDAAGNTYVAGSYATGTPNGTIPLTKIIVSKIAPAGDVLYRLIFGGSAIDTPTAIAVDSSGNLFVAGRTGSPDFPLVKALVSNWNGEGQGFLSKINPSGTLVFSTFIGSSQPFDWESLVDAIALDTAGNVYVTGLTYASAFPITPGAYSTSGNAFVMKIRSSGDRILFSTFIGSYGAGLAIAVDREGNITVAGSSGTAPGGFPATPGAFQTTCGCFREPGDPLTFKASYSASFVLRLSADGSHLIWSTYLGGNGSSFTATADTVQALALTSDGGVLVAGQAQSSDFPVTPGAFQTTLRQQPGAQGVGGLSGAGNLFITRLNATGTALKFSTYLGGSAGEQFNGLQLDAQEHSWVTGTTYSSDFPILPHSLALGDDFVVELAANGASLLATQMFPSGSAGAAFSFGASGRESLLGASGSLIQIQPGGISGVSILAQINAAAHTPSGRVSPGEIFSLYGTNLGPVAGVSAQPDSSGRFPNKLAGTQVTCNGIPAPLLYVSASQVNAVIPFEVSRAPSISVQVTSASAATTPLDLTLVSAYPEIFSMSSIQGYGIVVNEDGTLNSFNNPAPLGSTVTFWVNGAGLFAPALTDGAIVRPPLAVPAASVSVLFELWENQPIPATYTAAPGLVAGVLQVRATLPQQLAIPNSPATGADLQVQVGDAMTDPVQITFTHSAPAP